MKTRPEDVCYYCEQPIPNWYDPRLPKSCWRAECRAKENKDRS